MKIAAIWHFFMPKRSKKRPHYPSHLSNSKWEGVQGLIPARHPKGHPRKISMRRLLNAMFFITRAGCAWRLLPKKHFPPWDTVYGYFANGAKMASGNGCMTRCGRSCGKKPEDTSIRRREALTARASRPRQQAESRGLVRGRKFRGASVIFSWTPWCC
jgi:transposase